MEIAVASGKGGTGKTFLASNLAIFLERKLGGAVAVDADVEAPDLAIALGGVDEVLSRREVWESAKASIDYGRCTGCLKCYDACMFDAIAIEEAKPRIIEEYCEGCGACRIVCPEKAIEIRETLTGYLSVIKTIGGIYAVMGDLEVGGRNTGHVVYTAREEAKKLAEKLGKNFIVIDSAPGIGCPVVSSLSGAEVLIVVVEPIPQSLQGARRVLEVAKAFRLRSYLVLNKYDLNEGFSERIPGELGLEVLGRIPYDEEVVESYTMMNPIILSNPGGSIGRALEEVFENLIELVGLNRHG